KDIEETVWDLFVVDVDPDRSLIYTYSSRRGSSNFDVVSTIAKSPERVRGEEVFRVLGGIRRLKFYNVGLYGRGRQLSFRMFAGSEVAEAMSPANQAGSTKSNVFGVGYRAGESVDIGVSQKGTFWSM